MTFESQLELTATLAVATALTSTVASAYINMPMSSPYHTIVSWPRDQFWHHVTDLSIKTQQLFTAAPPRPAALTFSTQLHNFTASTLRVSSFTFQLPNTQLPTINFQCSTSTTPQNVSQLLQLSQTSPTLQHLPFNFHNFQTLQLPTTLTLPPQVHKYHNFNRGGGLEGGGGWNHAKP